MKLLISVSHNETTDEISCLAKMIENKGIFPVVYIGKRSYVVGVNITCALDLNDRFAYNFHIGSHCAIAHNVSAVIGAGHDYTKVYMGIIDASKTSEPFNMLEKGQILIQNDVWIGYNVTIMPGVTIHNGAVVAAGSVVTKDVAPYSIVGGNPAKHIKYRFEPEVIDAFQRIQWWYWPDEKKEENAKWFEASAEEFTEHFKNDLYFAKNANKPDIPEYKQTFLYVEDDGCGYSTLQNVVKNFAETYKTRSDCGLIIFTESANAENICTKVTDIAANIEAECGIYIHVGKASDMEALMANSDYFVSSRAGLLVKYSCMADYYKVKMLSGVDNYIFPSEP